MSYEKTANNIKKLDEVDRLRMRRLNEEVSGHAEEIARIMSRYLGIKLYPVGKATFIFGDDTDMNIEMEPKIVVGDGKGCAKDPPGISCECPCP